MLLDTRKGERQRGEEVAPGSRVTRSSNRVSQLSEKGGNGPILISVQHWSTLTHLRWVVSHGTSRYPGATRKPPVLVGFGLGVGNNSHTKFRFPVSECRGCVLENTTLRRVSGCRECRPPPCRAIAHHGHIMKPSIFKPRIHDLEAFPFSPPPLLPLFSHQMQKQKKRRFIVPLLFIIVDS